MSPLSIPNVEERVVVELCRLLVPEQQPMYVKGRPIQGALVQQCFQVVDKYASTHGGALRVGWNIVKLNGIWLEAEFHGVWESPDNTLFDLTPRHYPQPQYLFLPDPNRQYEGKQVESVFFPLTSNPAVLRHIQVAPEFFHETNKRDLANATSFNLTPRIAESQREMALLLEEFPWQG
ncbi:hypothetical protein [Massilia scottii]|uniref:hypothetical protein n=1 Tax=Massilia scottii TaxID=3057166 RepID=UPI002796A799|nr:hypothetical protein [Massilia sp. CCM 9029]MDQ1835213.1 hypothetical protein [Massilia sp. CCM 9029]